MPIGRRLGGKTSPMQVGTNRIEPADLHCWFFIWRRDQNLVPINPHVCDKAYFAIATQKSPSKIDRYSLWPANGNPNVCDHRTPNTVSVFNLKGGWHHGFARLCCRHVITGPCIVGPAGQ